MIERQARHLAEGIVRWARSNFREDGSWPYKYYPRQRRYSTADNAIRRFLMTIAAARWARLDGDDELRGMAVRNLRYNMGRYYRDGLIVEPERGAKLGAAALAGVAILECDTDEYDAERDALLASVNSMECSTNGFRTFFFPAERDGKYWNFYAGEALLFQAEAMRRGLLGAPEFKRWYRNLLRCFDRHADNRNPAYVPWATQAIRAASEVEAPQNMVNMVVVMNDWLLPMQQWKGVKKEHQGRFYSPEHPEYGPPHASSTGVYLEGLADAVKVLCRHKVTGKAVEEPDTEMPIDSDRFVGPYRIAVSRGLGSLRRLQYRIGGVERAGAVRVDDKVPTVRLDCMGHALAACCGVA